MTIVYEAPAVIGDTEGDFLLAYLEIFFRKDIAAIQKYNKVSKIFMALSIVFLVVGLVFFDYFVAFLVLSLLFLGIGIACIITIKRYRPKSKITHLGMVYYPIYISPALAGNYILVDGGGLAVPMKITTLQFQQVEHFQKEYNSILKAIREYMELISTSSSREQLKLLEQKKKKLILRYRNLEREIKEYAEKFKKYVSEKLVKEERELAVFPKDLPETDEILNMLKISTRKDTIPPTDNILNFAPLDVIEDSIEKIEETYHTITFLEERTKIHSLYDDIGAIFDSILGELKINAVDLLNLTFQFDEGMQHAFTFAHFCPKCRQSKLEAIRKKLDWNTWLDEHILSTALNDPLLKAPPAEVQEVAQEQSLRIDNFIKGHYPLPGDEFAIAIADLPVMEYKDGTFVCPVCGYKESENTLVMNMAFKPLAHTYERILDLMEEKRDEIAMRIYQTLQELKNSIKQRISLLHTLRNQIDNLRLELAQKDAHLQNLRLLRKALKEYTAEIGGTSVIPRNDLLLASQVEISEKSDKKSKKEVK